MHLDLKRARTIKYDDLDPNDPEAMRIFQNLAMSRLIKRNPQATQGPSGGLDLRSVSPDFLSMWKTRVQRRDSGTPQFGAIWKTRVG